MATVWAIILALTPSVGVGFLFYKVMKAIIEGDRNERLAHSRWEAEREATQAKPDAVGRRGAPPQGGRERGARRAAARANDVVDDGGVKPGADDGENATRSGWARP